MKNEVQKIYHLIENEISQMDPTKYHNNDAKTLLAEGDWIENLIQLSNFSLNALEISRIKAEFIGLGPIEHLLLDTEITEILILHEKDIWFEKNGSLLKHSDSFLGHLSFQNFVKKISHLIGQQYSLKTPYVNGRFENCRVHLIGPPLSTHFQISLRIFRKKSWSLLDLQRIDWAPEEQLQWLRESYLTKKSMLIIGNTGSGKTSLLNALLRESPKNERCLIIEDTDEIQKPNNVSSKLIARIDQAGFENIDLGELLKQSLRMRPDRIVLGEVRGSEAKNLILALSSGHTGSLTTIHAENAAQSLLRLEILIQMGAPTWSLQTIRKLILLGLDYIITLGSNRKNRTLHSIHKIQSLENNGFTLTTIYQNRLSKNKYI